MASEETILSAPFQIGTWRVYPDRNEVVGPAGPQKLEPMSMRLLVLLSENAPRTTSRDEMIDRLWSGRAVTDDAVNKQISKLRAVLEQGSDGAKLIETVAKVGARLTVSPVEAKDDQPVALLKRRRLAPVWIAALLAAVGLAIWGLAVDADDEFKLVQAPVTAAPGVERDPALSHDGAWLAYSSRIEPTEPFALLVRRIESDEVRRVTPAGVNARAPAWATDGRLAYIADEGAQCRIVVGRPGGTFLPVSNCIAAFIGGLSWAGENQIIVSDRSGDGQSFRLAMLDLRTGQRRTLTQPPQGDAGDTTPIFSPSRGRVYFLRNRSVGPSEVHAIELGSGAIRALTNDGAVINGLALGPDETLFVSSNREDRGFALWTLDPESREWRYVAPGPAPDLTSSADGRALIFLRTDTRVALWRAPLSDGDGNVVAPSTGVDWSPVLAPDGRRLAFLSSRSGSEEVWLTDLVSGAIRRVSNFDGAEIQDLAWSPNGLWIVVSVPNRGQFDLHLIDLQSGTTRRLLNTPQDERQPFFSADGSSLNFVRRNGPRFELMALELVSGRERRVASGVIRAAPSIDGRHIYFVRPFTAGLFRMAASGGAVERLAPWPDASGVRNFVLHGDSVWGLVRDNNGSTLMRVELASGRNLPVRHLPQTARRTGLAIVGDTVIYARVLRAESDLVQLRLSR